MRQRSCACRLATAALSAIVVGQRNTVTLSVNRDRSLALPSDGARATQSSPYTSVIGNSRSSATGWVKSPAGQANRCGQPTPRSRPCRVMATVSSPTSVIRARSRLAPTACSDKPSHSNGNLVSSDSARMPPAAMPCRIASSSTGCRREPTRVGLHLLWQRRLDEHLGAAAPHRAQARGMPDRIRIRARPASGRPRKRRSVPRPPGGHWSNSSLGVASGAGASTPSAWRVHARSAPSPSIRE